MQLDNRNRKENESRGPDGASILSNGATERLKGSNVRAATRAKKNRSTN